MSWTCEEARARLDEWIEGALSDVERRALAAHLETCAACRAEAAGLERLRSAAAGLPREIRPPRDLWPAIDARLDALEAGAPGEAATDRDAPDADPDSGVRLMRPRRAAAGFPVGSGLPRWALVAAALALVIVTAVVTASLTRRWDQAMALKLRQGGEAPAGSAAEAGGDPAAGGLDGGGSAGGELADEEARFLAASQELLTGLEGGDLSPETMAIVRRNLAVIDAAIAELRVALEKDPGNGDLTRMLLATYQRKIELLEQAARAGEEG